MMSRYPCDMKNRIRELRESLGLSQEQLGQKLGVHWQTVHRAETGKSALSIRKTEAYAQALGVGPDDLLSRASSARSVTVTGFVQAGEWAETWEWDEEQRYEIAIPDDPELRPFNLFAAEARGPSMNKRYPEGTVLVFTNVIETEEQVRPGKRYIVERERSDGLREATVKLFWIDEAGKPWLLPESDDPRFQQPIALDAQDGDTVRIVGQVRFAVSRE